MPPGAIRRLSSFPSKEEKKALKLQILVGRGPCPVICKIAGSLARKVRSHPDTVPGCERATLPTQGPAHANAPAFSLRRAPGIAGASPARDPDAGLRCHLCVKLRQNGIVSFSIKLAAFQASWAASTRY